MQVARRRPKPEPQHPNSQRWQTTLSADLERVAKQLEGSEAYDTSKRVSKLKETKLANTSTSISFGNEPINYTSDMMYNMSSGGVGASFAERETQRLRLKSMKKALTTTNFTLGDNKTDYSSTSRDAMKNSEGYTYNIDRSGNDEVKKAVKSSSVHFGNEVTNYESCAAEGYVSRQKPGHAEEAAKKKADIAAMTANLRKHNFSFGEETTQYITDSAAGYGSVPIKAYSQRSEALPKIRETIQDSRSCHFSLGLDKIHYESNTHAGFKGAAVDKDRASGLQRIKDMKKALQTTSICIGDDDLYM